MKTLLTIHEQDVNPEVPVVDTSSFRKRQAARAVVTDSQGRVALLHVGLHNYHKLPGGGIEEGEGIQTALARELMEEIGCEVEVAGEIGKVAEYRDQAELAQVSYCFTANQVGEECQPSFDEHEKEHQFSIVWANDINDAIRLLEGDKSIDYGSKFMRKRDLAILKAAREASRNER